MKNILKKVALVGAFVMTLGVGTTIGVNLNNIQTALAVENTTSNVWNGSYDIDWYDTSKTEFEINTAEQLAGLAKIVNGGNDMTGKTITLTNNILLNDISDYDKWSGPNDLGEIYSPANNWTSIGDGKDSKNGFNGTFNGNGFSIIGLYYFNTEDDYIGLFGYCKDESMVKNLKLEYEFIYNNKSYRTTAGLIGCNGGKVKNCYVYANITSMSGYIGGIVGDNSVSSGDHSGNIIDSCCFEGSINGRGTLGGIAGYNFGVIRYCYNNANIYNEYNENGPVGGIVGNNNGDMLECRNDGDMYCEYGQVGGIAGENDSSLFLIYDCYNTGNVTIGDMWYAGGVLGHGSYIQNCYSVGTVATSKNEDRLGGVVGCNGENITAITNCYYKLDPIYKGDGNSIEEYIVGKSASAMQTEEFATLLGDKFVYVENSYPRLAWELNNNNIWSINGNNTIDVPIKPDNPNDEYSRFDVNRDGSVNILDLIELKQYILGLISE